VKSTKNTWSAQMVRKRYISRSVETSSHAYFHVYMRSRSTCKLFKVLVSWPLTR